VTGPEGGWRQQKKNATRDRIRTSALRLFQEQGYDSTTVEQISAAAGVSHMTFFRYFPSKEDVALSDSYDPLFLGLLEQTPDTEPLLERIRGALEQGLERMYATNREALLAQNNLIVSTPALRERLWADQVATQEVILEALSGGQDELRHDVKTRVTVAACLAAASTAVLMWVEHGGTPELPELLKQSFDALTHLGSALVERRPGYVGS
jgi:AcrR family transcriptional regulator